MNEDEKELPQQKAGLDDKRKNALLRYVAILFAVAFLLVLFSLALQMRDSKATISQLNQSSASALQKVEQLQDNYQDLQTVNEDLTRQITDLEAQVEELSQRPEADEDILNAVETLRKQVKDVQSKTQEAYDALLYAMENSTDGSKEGNVALSKALETLEELNAYLGEKGLEVYETITSDTETQ